LIEDAKIGVRLKISALWVALLFPAAYLGDIDGDRPGSAEPLGSARST
jgi:hypothetical protein